MQYIYVDLCIYALFLLVSLIIFLFSKLFKPLLTCWLVYLTFQSKVSDWKKTKNWKHTARTQSNFTFLFGAIFKEEHFFMPMCGPGRAGLCKWRESTYAQAPQLPLHPQSLGCAPLSPGADFLLFPLWRGQPLCGAALQCCFSK